MYVEGEGSVRMGGHYRIVQPRRSIRNSTPGRRGAASRAVLLVLCAALVMLMAVSASRAAGIISYGNFGPVAPGVSFLQVEESSATDTPPLFGPPTPFSVGLDFDPQTFAAFASGGSQDITDGQLNFTVSTAPGLGVATLNLFEAGDFSLVGSGTTLTSDFAGAIIRATVIEINGAPVAPISLAPSNASVGFNLIANPGVAQPWSLGIGMNIGGQLPQGQRATKVKISINNQLIALSEQASAAFIAKKDFRIDFGLVPEPSAALLGLGAVGLVGMNRRRRASADV